MFIVNWQYGMKYSYKVLLYIDFEIDLKLSLTELVSEFVGTMET